MKTAWKVVVPGILAAVAGAFWVNSRVPAGADAVAPAGNVVEIAADVRTTVYQDTMPSCSDCAVEVRPVGHLGSLEDSILLRDMPVIERDSRGLIYAAVLRAQDHEMIVYDSGGTILRTIGNYGNGPGEFRSIWGMLISAGDSLCVGHDNMFSVFDSAGKFIRTVRMEQPFRYALRWLTGVSDGRVLLRGMASEDSTRSPLFRYDERGAFIGPMGPRPFAERTGFRSRGVSAPLASFSKEGMIWLAGDGGYRLELLDGDGIPQRVIGVVTPAAWDMPLFIHAEEYADSARKYASQPSITRESHVRQPGPRPTERRPTREPRTVLRAVHPLDREHVATLIHVPAVNWRDARVALDTTQYTVDVVPEPGYTQQLYDTVIDIIDVQSGMLLTRTRVPGMMKFTSSGALYRTSVTPDGVIQAEVFELDFRRGN